MLTWLQKGDGLEMQGVGQMARVTAWILGPPIRYVAVGSELTLQCR